MIPPSPAGHHLVTDWNENYWLNGNYHRLFNIRSAFREEIEEVEKWMRENLPDAVWFTTTGPLYGIGWFEPSNQDLAFWILRWS